jgi:hypothetical protein
MVTGRSHAFLLGNHKLMALAGSEREPALLVADDLARDDVLEIAMLEAVLDLGDEPAQDAVEGRRLVPARQVSHLGALSKVARRRWSCGVTALGFKNGRM